MATEVNRNRERVQYDCKICGKTCNRRRENTVETEDGIVCKRCHRSTKRTPEIEVEEFRTKCPKCGSTERETIATKREEYRTVNAFGEEFRYIVRRWRRCSCCGQRRVERSYEN